MSENVPVPAGKRLKKHFKIIVLGGMSVGKSTLLYRYDKGVPPEIKLKATVGCALVTKVLNVEGTEIEIRIWDPTGQERFRKAIPEQLYRNPHAVVFVYDITCQESFLDIDNWLAECKSRDLRLENIPVVLLANKQDLKESAAVSEEEGRKYAEEHNMMYYETSSFGDRVQSQVEDVFLYIGRILKFMPVLEDDNIITPKKSDLEKDSKGCCEKVNAFFKKIFWFFY